MASASTAPPLDETCPLLESQVLAKPAPTPIPKGQLAALCTVRIVEPIAFTQLFPYVNEFMIDLHLTDDPSRVGFYSGLVVRCVSICAPDASSSPYSGKCLCGHSTHLHIPLGSSLWSVYSQPALRALISFLDVIGRRPVILLGFLGITVTTLVFGLSKSFAAVLIARCIGQSQVCVLPSPSLPISPQVAFFLETSPSFIQYWAKLPMPLTRPLYFPFMVLSILWVQSLGWFTHPAHQNNPFHLLLISAH